MLRVLILAGAVSAYYFSSNADLGTNQVQTKTQPPVQQLVKSQPQPASPDAAANVMRDGDAAAANIIDSVNSVTPAQVQGYVRDPATLGVALEKSTATILAASREGLNRSAAALETGNRWLTWWNQAPTSAKATTE